MCPGSPYTLTHARTCTRALAGAQDHHAGIHMRAPGLEPWPRSVLTPLLPQPACCALNSHFNSREAGSESLRSKPLINCEAGGQPGRPPHLELAPAVAGSSLELLWEQEKKALGRHTLCPPKPSHLSTQRQVNQEVNTCAERNRAFKRGKPEMPKGGA